jgi:SET domain-containing protein
MMPAYQKFAVEVRASRIDGQGVFAAEAVPARRKIGEIRGESISVDDARIRATRSARVMIVELSARRAIDFSKSADPMRYTNHACTPNARLDIRQGRVEFYALRDIGPGEEITVHYGETHHQGALACRCGSPGCAGWL